MSYALEEQIKRGEVELDKARTLEVQTRAIANLIISVGATPVYDPQSIIKAVISNDLSLLITPESKENA
jgi:hypothetical protein